MSWTETGKVISTASNLIVRIKFGQLLTFPNKGNYKKDDKITLLCKKGGDIGILECEHNATSNVPPDPPKVEDINYGDLEYLEDLE